MLKLVITGNDVDLFAIMALTGKTLTLAGTIYLVGGGVIPPGVVTRYECELFETKLSVIYERTTLQAAARSFHTDGAAIVINDEGEEAGVSHA